ncbi:MAG: GNAT family N-acetyltransferase [Planctomycetales bacterium]|nr:GNAT family N-acetyltransferase [Planctomycetales bacterium]
MTAASEPRCPIKRWKQRQLPTGLGFALADSIAYMDGSAWDRATQGASVFLGRPYLGALERAAPEGLQLRYAIAYRGREPAVALAAQLVELSGTRMLPAEAGFFAKLAGKVLSARLLVCGNLLSWGPHGAALASGEDPAILWPAVAEALVRLRRAEKLSQRTDLVMVKDFPGNGPGNGATDGAALEKFGFRALETDPDMVLEIPSTWKGYDDYLGSLTGKYRKAAREIAKEAEAAGGRIERLANIAGERDRLHALYLQVHEKARVRLTTLPPSYLPALAEALGDRLRCNVFRLDGGIAGFVTTIRDGETAVGYTMGMDRAAAEKAPVYLRLLHAVVSDAIEMGCRRLSLGRTALEPKARLGAKPAPLAVYLRHRLPVLGSLVRKLLGSVPIEEAPERNPFK